MVKFLVDVFDFQAPAFRGLAAHLQHGDDNGERGHAADGRSELQQEQSVFI